MVGCGIRLRDHRGGVWAWQRELNDLLLIFEIAFVHSFLEVLYVGNYAMSLLLHFQFLTPFHRLVLLPLLFDEGQRQADWVLLS